MAIYHCSIKSISRGAGRSIIAAAAYCHACKIESEKTGEVHDYSRKQGVDSSAIYLPSGVNPAWAQDRQRLWNAVDVAEKRKNACMGREVVLALPAELSELQRRKLVEEMARHLADRYILAVDVAIHKPSRHGDIRNYHAHILMSSRRITSEGFGAKARELDDYKTRGAEVEHIRAEWEKLANRALERADKKCRIDHRSLKAQGVDRVPTVHMGVSACAMERRGLQTERGELNREIRSVNEALEKQQKKRSQADILTKEYEKRKIDRENFVKKLNEDFFYSIEKVKNSDPFVKIVEIRRQWTSKNSVMLTNEIDHPSGWKNFLYEQAGKLKDIQKCGNPEENEQKQKYETALSILKQDDPEMTPDKANALLSEWQHKIAGKRTCYFIKKRDFEIWEKKARLIFLRKSEERERQRKCEEKMRLEKAVEDWKNLGIPSYTDEEKKIVDSYLKIFKTDEYANFRRDWIRNGIKDIEKVINEYTTKINELDGIVEKCNQGINEIKNKGIMGCVYYFERKDLEKKCNITQLEINEYKKQIDEQNKELSNEKARLSEYDVLEKGSAIIQKRSQEAKERQEKALTPEIREVLLKEKEVQERIAKEQKRIQSLSSGKGR